MENTHNAIPLSFPDKRNWSILIIYTLFFVLVSYFNIKHLFTFDPIELSNNIAILNILLFFIAAMNSCIFVFVSFYVNVKRGENNDSYLHAMESATFFQIIIAFILYFPILIYTFFVFKNVLINISIAIIYMSLCLYIINKILKSKITLVKLYHSFDELICYLIFVPFILSSAVGYLKVAPDIKSNDVSIAELVPFIVQEEPNMKYDLDGVFGSYKECRISGWDKSDLGCYLWYKTFESNIKIIYDNVLKNEVYETESFTKLDYIFETNASVFIKDNELIENGKFIIIKFNKITLIETNIRIKNQEIEFLVNKF